MRFASWSIWCYASDYAHAHGLKGLFSGMFISKEPEVCVNGVDTDPEEIDDKAQDFSERFGEMMRSGRPLEEIAAELMDPRHRDSELPGLLNDTEAVLGALFTEPARIYDETAYMPGDQGRRFPGK